jgi:ribosomal protein S18 acetylase RimI-like enzyme
MIHCEGSFGLVAYQNGKLSGLILGGEEQFYDGGMFTIKEFCVDRELRHTGVGTSLLNACEKRLKEKGIRTSSYLQREMMEQKVSINVEAFIH